MSYRIIEGKLFSVVEKDRYDVPSSPGFICEGTSCTLAVTDLLARRKNEISTEKLFGFPVSYDLRGQWRVVEAATKAHRAGMPFVAEEMLNHILSADQIPGTEKLMTNVYITCDKKRFCAIGRLLRKPVVQTADIIRAAKIAARIRETEILPKGIHIWSYLADELHIHEYNKNRSAISPQDRAVIKSVRQQALSGIQKNKTSMQGMGHALLTLKQGDDYKKFFQIAEEARTSLVNRYFGKTKLPVESRGANHVASMLG